MKSATAAVLGALVMAVAAVPAMAQTTTPSTPTKRKFAICGVITATSCATRRMCTPTRTT